MNNVVVNSPDVVLRNMVIEGDLTLGEGIGEGDVTLQNIQVKGQTIVSGGGENSVYFEDSVLATVIVNKNNGKIRVVASGNTQVAEVVLESPAKLEEDGLVGESTGFEDVTIGESVQTVNDLQVEFIGAFETINSRASQVRINLPTGTSIRDIAINAVAQILGEGVINTATINAVGTSINSRPENVVLNSGSVNIGDEVVNESFSSAESTALQGIELQMGSIAVQTADFVAGLSMEDFKVSATLDGEAYVLENLSYNPNTRTIKFNPLNVDENTAGKRLGVTVEPSEATLKLTGDAVSDEIETKTGFSGRITDVQGVGIANIQIDFRAGANAREGEVVATATTDASGYYTVYVDPGEYTGEIKGQGILRTYMYATSLSGTFNTDQNETAIRATAMDAVKIVLTWGEHPRDQDSHLEGPSSGQGNFHTYYGNRIHQEDGVKIVDLDWDDVDSYGPETTTIYKLVDGKYRFYVHNFSEDMPLVGSDAKIEIYKGNETAPSEVFEVASAGDNGDALYWVGFEMTVENEAISSVDPVNKLVGVRPAFEVNEQQYDNRWGDSFLDTEVSEENPLTVSIPNAETDKTYYRIGDDGEEQLYTGPFQLTSPATITAWSSAMDEYSSRPKGDLFNRLTVESGLLDRYKTELSSKLEAAKLDIAETAVAISSDEVSEGKYWVIEAEKNIYQEAIDSAQNVFDSGDATFEGIHNASNYLSYATNRFDSVKQMGTKVVAQSSDAILKANATVKGVQVQLGSPSASIADISGAGSVSLDSVQAENSLNEGDYVTLFEATDANAEVKVVKYSAGAFTDGFDTDAEYSGENIAVGDFFLVRVTAEDETVQYYKINVNIVSTQN